MKQYRASSPTFGADYNPEQWPENTWGEDVRLMQRAGMNAATVGVFSWARLQPGPDRFEFDWMDRLIEGLHAGGIRVILATPTAAPPAWLCRLHPDMLSVTADGVRQWYGSRRHYCPNSPAYRAAAREIAARLAERYGTHPAVMMWHVDNEYGSDCYCDQCATAFQRWLEQRYRTLGALNGAWNTAFWSQTYSAWHEVLPPRRAPTYHNPGQVLDYRRFVSDALLECFLDQKTIIREAAPDTAVTTNFMGWFKGADYWSWAPHVDLVSWDSYPPPDAPAHLSAAWHDVMRSLKDAPFLLMEQSPGQVNWMRCNRPKPPGEMRLQSYAAMAHGADGICYFQFRQSSGGPEQFHAGVVPHVGAERSRVYAEVAALGAELQRLGERPLDRRTPAEVAIVLDWNSWWALEEEPRITDRLTYVGEILRYYRALWSANIPVDFVPPGRSLARYRLVLAPALRIITAEAAAEFERYVREGGTLLLTFASGLTDDHDRAQLGGYPGPVRDLFGIWIEEFDPLCDGTEQANWEGSEFTCELWCDAVNLAGARAEAIFTSGFCTGLPALTVHDVGAGRAVYVATAPDVDTVARLLGRYCAQAGVHPPFTNSESVEVTWRVREHDVLTWVLNHSAQPHMVALPGLVRDLLTGREMAGETELAGRGVWLLEQR